MTTESVSSLRQARSSRKVSPTRGRWVVVLEAGGTPILWSHDCESLRKMFLAIRNVCPEAQLVWEPAGDGDAKHRVRRVAGPQSE